MKVETEGTEAQKGCLLLLALIALVPVAPVLVMEVVWSVSGTEGQIQRLEEEYGEHAARDEDMELRVRELRKQMAEERAKPQVRARPWSGWPC
jgi:phage shock protein A